MPNEVAVIETSFGNIEFEFLEDKAPGHVKNFKDLANGKFYNGTTFHRVIPGSWFRAATLTPKAMTARLMAQADLVTTLRRSSTMKLMLGGLSLWRVHRIRTAQGHSFL